MTCSSQTSTRARAPTSVRADRGSSVSSTLRSPTVARVLDRLHAAAGAEDEPAKQRVRAREAQLGVRLAQAERYELYGDAPLAIKREVGELLYVLALSRRTRRVVEFGASLGASSVYLAAAVRDCGGGSLITTELRPSKAGIARRNPRGRGSRGACRVASR